MSNQPPAANDFFNYLGLDPFAPSFPPSHTEIKRIIRGLKLLLHPDKVATNADAARAQNELRLSFVTLQSIESALGNKKNAHHCTITLESLSKTGWTSTWNPRRIENGPLLAPLPSWTRRFGPRHAHSPPVINFAAFPPCGILGAPRFDSGDVQPAIVPDETTRHLAHLGVANAVPGCSGACVAIARLRYRSASCPVLGPSSIAVVGLKRIRGDASASLNALECWIWQEREQQGTGTRSAHVATVLFSDLLTAAAMAHGSMWCGMSQVRLLGVFARVPRRVLDLYVKMFLLSWLQLGTHDM